MLDAVQDPRVHGRASRVDSDISDKKSIEYNIVFN